MRKVYPLEAILLLPKISKRQLNNFVDLLEVQIMTDSRIDAKTRNQWYTQADALRYSDGPPPDKPFNRAAFEQLREAMGKKKGRAPVRVK